jgi:5'(3')-deoxyribonucleotidase
VGNVHFTSHFTPQVGTLTKGEICKKFGVNIFVDDAPMHIEKVAPHVEQAFLMDAPWNQNYVLTAPNIQRVHSWEEIRAFLGGI